MASRSKPAPRAAHPRLMLASLAIAVGVVAAVWYARPWRDRLMAAHLLATIADGDDAQASRAVDHAAALGEPGIAVLVEAMDSQRASVARRARQLLLDEFDRWRTLPARESTPKLAALARSLASRVEQTGPASQALARDLAERILHWPTDPEVLDRTVLLADCQTVLRATAHLDNRPLAAGTRRNTNPERAVFQELAPELAKLVPPQPVEPIAKPAQDAEARITPPPISADEPTAAAANPVLTESTGDANHRDDPSTARPSDRQAKANPLPDSLAPRSLPIQGLPAPQLRDQRAGDVLSEPRLLPGTLDEQDQRLRDTPRRFLKPPAPQMRKIPRSNVDRHQPSTIRQLTGVAPLAAERTVERASAEQILQWMRQLHAENPSDAQAAHRQLAQQGFSPRHLALCAQLTNPDPQVRLSLIERLPDMDGIDVDAWLARLCRDRDAEVRLAALTVRATHADSAGLAAIESLARRDHDPRIVKLADRLRQLLKGSQ